MSSLNAAAVVSLWLLRTPAPQTTTPGETVNEMHHGPNAAQESSGGNNG